MVESSNQNERLNGTIDTDYYDVSALRGYRVETGFTVGSGGNGANVCAWYCVRAYYLQLLT